MIDVIVAPQGAILIHPITRHSRRVLDPAQTLAEAQGLAEALGLNVRLARSVVLKKISPATFIGGGLIEELVQQLAQFDAKLLVFDGELTPAQQRNLENKSQAKVLDRTGLILEIFSLRARTKEGRLQVELARIAYERSRLVRTWTHLERQRGGKGFLAGPGERQIESDRRILSEKAQSLTQQLEKVRRTRNLHRKARKNRDCPLIALVGYTNAGKSTLFNYVTDADVLVKDMLFATLDPTIREFVLPGQKKVLLSDTVGFISALPTELIAAFRATLEEVVHADLIVHVRDIASGQSSEQKYDVEEVLRKMGQDGHELPPMIEVWNKIDLLSPDEQERIAKRAKKQSQPAIIVSASTGQGMDHLRDYLAQTLSTDEKTLQLEIAEEESAMLGWLHQHGRILTCEPNKAGNLQCCVALDTVSLGRFHAAYPKYA